MPGRTGVGTMAGNRREGLEMQAVKPVRVFLAAGAIARFDVVPKLRHLRRPTVRDGEALPIPVPTRPAREALPVA